MTTDTGFTYPEIEKRYRQYMADMHGELDIPRLCEVMWFAGGRHALAASVEFADIVPMLRQIETKAARLAAFMEALEP